MTGIGFAVAAYVIYLLYDYLTVKRFAVFVTRFLFPIATGMLVPAIICLVQIMLPEGREHVLYSV